MGVPHLITNLQPFAVNHSLSGSRVVIDGPSLVYHIYFICLRAQRSAKNPFEASPSYDVLGEEVTNWLDELQNHGAVVEKIYFDGFLPASKLETRLRRLIQCTLQLRAYHDTYPSEIPSMNDFDTSASYRPVPFANIISSSRLASFPALPFIVPAVIEKLKNSVSYQQITEVIPGEADSFCALHLRQRGGVVLTSDSDLLVHEIGAQSSVCFLKDLSYDESSFTKVLNVPHYRPSYIIERLGFQTSHGLRALAFQMRIEPHWSLPQLQQIAKKLEASAIRPKEFEDFLHQYSQFNLDVDGDHYKRADCFQLAMTQTLKGLDPRISEFVLQFPYIANQASMPELAFDIEIGPLRDIDVFLPFLLDCPKRTSAWELSTPIRQLAYGLVNLILPAHERITTVIEYRRRENNARGRQWQLPTFDEIQEACTAHLEALENIRRLLPGSSSSTVWRVFAIYQEIFQSQRSGKPSLAVTLKRLPTLVYSSIISWDEVHFLAQLQGFYYSFRILKQILATVICFEPSHWLARHIHDLKLQLDTLPTLSDLPSFLQDIKQQRSKGFGTDVETALGLLDLDVQTVPIKPKLETTKKRARCNTEQTVNASLLRRSNNIFDILDTE